MKRKSFEVTIWKFKEVLHRAIYEFSTSNEARNYALGMYNGMSIMGAEPTGVEVKPRHMRHSVSQL